MILFELYKSIPVVDLFLLRIDCVEQHATYKE